MEIVYENETESSGFECMTKRIELIIKVEDKYIANVIKHQRGWFGNECESYSKVFDSLQKAHKYIEKIW